MSVKSVVETADLGRGLALNLLSQKIEANLGTGLGFSGNQIIVTSVYTPTVSNLTASSAGAGNGVQIGTANVVNITPTVNNARAKMPNPALNSGRVYCIRNTSSTLTVTLETLAGALMQGTAITTTATITMPPNAARKTIHIFSDGTNWIWGSIQ